MPSISKSHVYSLLAPPGAYFDYSGEINLLLIHKLKRRKLHYLTFAFVVKVTKNVAQYPLHHVTFVPAKFEIATCEGLEGFGGDAFIRSKQKTARTYVHRHGWTDRRKMDQLWYEIKIPFV